MKVLCSIAGRILFLEVVQSNNIIIIAIIIITNLFLVQVIVSYNMFFAINNLIYIDTEFIILSF